MQLVFMLLMLMTAVFLILLVLVQRGRGGGLTGALGGMGGQSAFGSKAGDLFTRITIGVAAFWIVLCVAAIKLLNSPDTVFGDTDQTTFEESATPSLTTETPDTSATEEPPNEVRAESTSDSEMLDAIGEPAADSAGADTATESPRPAGPPQGSGASEASPKKSE